MIALKKIWLFLKTHWYIPVIFIVSLILKSKSDTLSKMMDASKESYRKQKDAIITAEHDKKTESSKIEAEYKNTVKAIDRLYNSQSKKLEQEKKKEIKKIVEEYYNNPEELSSQISNLFGVTYVPKKNNNNSS